MVVVVIYEAHHAKVPKHLPAIAVGSLWVYWAERAFPLIVVGLLVITAVYYAVFEGRVPTEFGRAGLKYTTETARAASELRGLVEGHAERLAALEARFLPGPAPARAEAVDLVVGLEQDLEDDGGR